MKKNSCWACAGPLEAEQKICRECHSWQNWRRFVDVSNTSIALLIALISVVALLGSKIQSLYDDLFPEREVHISGYFSQKDKNITLTAYNFGKVPANLGSSIHCIFGLENAMRLEKTDKGVEAEFWTVEERIVQPSKDAKITFRPQNASFDTGNEKILCFGGLNYLGRTTPVEYFFLAIVPKKQHSIWPIEGLFTTKKEIEKLYPRVIDFDK